MFSLIIVIISIALVAALALATLYYGGNIVEDGQARAQATKVIQESNQVTGALELYKADNGAFPAGTSEQIQQALLAGDYLKQIPSGEWNFETNFAVRSDLSEESCQSINERMGINTIPLCSDTTYNNRAVCCLDN